MNLHNIKSKYDTLVNTLIKNNLKTKGLADTIETLVDVDKYPNSLEAVYEYSSEEQRKIYSLAQMEWEKDSCNLIFDDEGHIVFYPFKVRVIRRWSNLTSRIDDEFIPWEEYKAKCREKYNNELGIQWYFNNFSELNKLSIEYNQAYCKWYSKYSHIWKDQGLRYSELCEREGYYVCLNVECLTISEYIREIEKYYKYMPKGNY